MVQGAQAAKDGSRDRAIALLREAIALDHGLWEAHYDLGVVLAGAGDLAGAEDELRTASKLAPDAEEVAIALGELRRRRGENKEAADALGDFLQDHPNAIDARILEVTALRDSGQLDAALKQAQEVLVRKPGDAGGARRARAHPPRERRAGHGVAPGEAIARCEPEERGGRAGDGAHRARGRGRRDRRSRPSRRRRSSTRRTRRRGSTWARCSCARARTGRRRSSTARSCRSRRTTRARRWGSRRRCAGRAMRSIRRSSRRRGRSSRRCSTATRTTSPRSSTSASSMPTSSSIPPKRGRTSSASSKTRRAVIPRAPRPSATSPRPTRSRHRLHRRHPPPPAGPANAPPAKGGTR